jgi:hypothetical protein
MVEAEYGLQTGERGEMRQLSSLERIKAEPLNYLEHLHKNHRAKQMEGHVHLAPATRVRNHIILSDKANHQ